MTGSVHSSVYCEAKPKRNVLVLEQRIKRTTGERRGRFENRKAERWREEEERGVVEVKNEDEDEEKAANAAAPPNLGRASGIRYGGVYWLNAVGLGELRSLPEYLANCH